MSQRPAPELPAIAHEFDGIDLGDKRRNARLVRVASRVAVSPGESFPRLMSSVAEREALYRLLNNDEVRWEDILAPHVAATAQRSTAQGLTRVVHDTTDFVFSGDRDGMGPVMRETRGFFGHVALAVSGGEERVPLGVAGMMLYARGEPSGKSLNERKRDGRRKPRQEKESHRWEALAQRVAASFPTNDVVHVMDQEADDFVMMVELQTAGLRFVVRGSCERQLWHLGPSVGQHLDASEAFLFRSVPLSKRETNRSAKNRKMHPPRQERIASLQVRWTSVDLEKPPHAQTSTEVMPLNVVQVFEPEPPEGEQAISWTLFTNEPVTDVTSATAVVDHYRSRWRIEEYFRSLKQGCAVQKRQLESLDAMTNAIAMLAPIAWRLLLLRSLGQSETTVPATQVFEQDEIDALGALLEHKACKPLPKSPTMRDMMLAVAAIGGHITNNGDPGWIVLGRGFEDLVKATLIWRAARAAQSKGKRAPKM